MESVLWLDRNLGREIDARNAIIVPSLCLFPARDFKDNWTLGFSHEI
jgi:hypothetical protein